MNVAAVVQHVLSPVIAGAACLVAWRAHQRAKAAHRYVSLLKRQMREMSDVAMEVTAQAMQQGLQGFLAHVESTPRGFQIRLLRPDGEILFTYEETTGKFFQIGKDANEEIDPTDESSGLPEKLREFFIECQQHYREILQAKKESH